ncbi:MAG: type I-C CRISPR-associated protein Cas7/Csd2 [Endomicrobium sp.]|jgi:CRISPR-associated protein Csd2|nr:type I-C CRISPR-associated protein Cas7/Csd2 [Endomicrobium sp.]
MSTLNNKIDFAVVFKVTNANPNGDPLNENIPRTDFDGYGEVSDVCIKRKIRNRLVDLINDGTIKDNIFVQSEDYKQKGDNYNSLKERAEGELEIIEDTDKCREIICSKWIDVRAFGQVFAFKTKKGIKGQKDDKKQDKEEGISIGIRGPVSIQHAFSKEPIDAINMGITKSVNGEPKKDRQGETEDGMSHDRMGQKHFIRKAIYVFYGAINPQLAEKTGFSDEDAKKIKSVLPKLFENDESSARPAGSIEILKVIWWQHNSKLGQHSSAKVHHSLEVGNDGEIKINELKDLKPEIIEGY